ncbi:MAG: hypothetical protein MUE75_01370 [Algoriphagus sp.]|jgi:hypothetical protein|nr:hypothetical protein [Algoriphagus sp.]
MKTLPKNWLTQGWIDFEYKKYQLLAYLQEAEKEFRSVKVYPTLTDLMDHHRTLKELESGKTQLKNLFPKALNGIDFQNAQLHYQTQIHEDHIMDEITQITAFALPKLKVRIEEGKRILDFVEANVVFEPVGIQPIYTKEGYLMVTQEKAEDIYTFRYKSNLIQLAGEKFKNISIRLVGVFRKSLAFTLEKLKLQLINDCQDLPNPATWRLHSPQSFPLQETILPVGQRLLLPHLKE